MNTFWMMSMSLDFYLQRMEPVTVFDANITHNLSKMADEAGIYYALWRPEEIHCTKAYELIPLLKEGLRKLESKPEYYKKFDSPNGWGIYDNFVSFVKKVLAGCEEFPEADIRVSR